MKLSMRVVAFAALALFSLSVYSGSPKRPLTIKVSDLSPVPNVAIKIADRFVVATEATWASPAAIKGLLPGEYVSRYSDNKGTFYFGNDRAYFGGDVNDKIFLRKGGFWLPNDGSSPQLFYIVDDRNELAYVNDLDSLSTPKHMRSLSMGLIGNLANDAQIGRLVLLPPISDSSISSKLGSEIRSQLTL